MNEAPPHLLYQSASMCLMTLQQSRANIKMINEFYIFRQSCQTLELGQGQCCHVKLSRFLNWEEGGKEEGQWRTWWWCFIDYYKSIGQHLFQTDVFDASCDLNYNIASAYAHTKRAPTVQTFCHLQWCIGPMKLLT